VTWLLAGLAIVVSVVGGRLVRRLQGWDPQLHRMTLVVLLLPWVAQHGSLVRLSRNAALNPLGRRVADAALLPADWLAPLLLGLALGACLVRTRRLRGPSILLPLLGSALVWWVTVPLYARSMMRGWFFLTEGLAGPWPFVYHLSASAFLAGWLLPATEPTGGGEPA